MSQESFTTTISVDVAPHVAFAAITNPRGWWSTDIEGPTANLGDEFAYSHGDMHRCRLRVVASVPGEKVAWHVLENYFSFTEDQTEWTNTTIAFDLAEKDGSTEIVFTHHGLTPKDECYDACANGWTDLVANSLKGLIIAGAGQPITAG